MFVSNEMKDLRDRRLDINQKQSLMRYYKRMLHQCNKGVLEIGIKIII